MTMIVLNALLTPDLGLGLWSLITFVLLLLLLRKFAWGPIVGGLQTREQGIVEALESAKKAREEMSNLKSENEELLKQARLERDQMLREARDIREKTISEARDEAQAEKRKIVASATDEIQREKERAFNEVKDKIAVLAVEATEKILRAQLSNEQQQEQLVERYLQDTKLS